MTAEALDALVAAAQARLRKFINRAAAQHLRRMAEKYQNQPQTLPSADPI